MKQMNIFLKNIGSKKSFEVKDVLKVNIKRFFVDDSLKEFVFNKEKAAYAGEYLGDEKQDEFIPSFGLLDKISEENVNKIYLDRKTAWLFLCRRDIFEGSILKTEGNFEEEELFLVMLDDDCLGYGCVDLFQGKKILKNLADRGDFLRREKKLE